MKPISATIVALLGIVPAQAEVFARYSFDTDYNDQSGYARHGTLTDVGTIGNSGITSIAGDFKFGGGAMHFSADRDFVAIPEKTFSSGTSYTYAFWAKKAPGDTGGSAQYDMVVGDRNNANFFIALNDANNASGRTGLRWRSSSSATERQADFVAPNDNAWHHYAIVSSGTNVTLYLDGAFVSTATGKLNGFTSNTIGEAYTTANDFDFHGQIDEMWIFDEAVSAARIAALYNFNNPDALPEFPGFHQAYDGDFNDSGSSGNDGIASGAAAITTDNAAIASGSGALSLDGEDSSYVTLSNPGAFNATTAWSVTWWARRSGLGTNKGMVMGDAANTNDFIWLNDNFTGLRFRSSSSATFDFTAPKDEELRHYALVADGLGNLSLYLNGEFSQTLTGNTSFAINTIGKAYPTSSLHYNFQGSLDEIHLFNSALSGTEVADIYSAEKPAIPITRLRVVLIGGQSNADGRAAISELPTSPVNLQNPQPDVDLFYQVQGGTPTLTTLRPGLSETAQFGPEIVLGRRLADLYQAESGTRVAIIKYANGGTNLHTQWKGGGDGTTAGDGPEYVVFQQTVTQGLAALAAAYPLASIDLQSMVWLQGETDAVAGSASLYETNLTHFIADVRTTYGNALPFVIARLSSRQTNLNSTYLNTVRAAQDAVAAADPRTSIIDTDSFGIKSDNLHFDGSGQQSIGSGFAGETAYYEWMTDTFSPADIDAGLAEPDADRDGDGRSNRSEFIGASDPLAGSSSFLASVSRTGPGTGEISYDSSAARLYSVEHWLETTATWETILPALQGTGSTVVRPLNTPDLRGIYRVKSRLP